MGKLDPLETVGQATVVHVELISVAIAFFVDKFTKLLQFGGRKLLCFVCRLVRPRIQDPAGVLGTK